MQMHNSIWFSGKCAGQSLIFDLVPWLNLQTESNLDLDLVLFTLKKNR